MKGNSGSPVCLAGSNLGERTRNRGFFNSREEVRQTVPSIHPCTLIEASKREIRWTTRSTAALRQHTSASGIRSGFRGPHDDLLETIVGRNGGLRAILAQVAAVAHTNATVLIDGETGTGKEVIARDSRVGPRRHKNLVRLSCAAMPPELLERELFGHERGAFTGTTHSHVGRFALADRGTLFLDEIGDVPLEDKIRQEILTECQRANWKLGGPRGAAARLGLKRTTLFYKMKRLGIAPPADHVQD